MNEEIDQLVEDYPNFIESETLLDSVIGKEIKVLRISKDIKAFNKNLSYNSNKKNTFYIAGLHAREVVAPVSFLKVIRNNLKKAIEGDKDTLEMLSHNVIHFIPLVNPDGFDLSKFGKSHEIFGESFNKFLKANNNGVDINNNFPDLFFDADNNKWTSVEKKAVKESLYISREPSVAFYWGTELQPETKNIVDYMDRYYFEFFVDIHSQGNYIFWDSWFLSDQYRKENLRFAKKIQIISSKSDGSEPYYIEDYQSKTAPHGYGYSTAYYASNFSNPTLTIETSTCRNMPYFSVDEYQDIIDRFNDIFIEADKYESIIYPHRVYRNNQIYGDYNNENTARAIAKRIDGIYKYEKDQIKEIEYNFIREIIEFYYKFILELVN
ncbi:MAG: M14 family zinc carboxypeptidase [Bacillota bacterium]|nr:M14 family zinc carboxypeptidase [Bacillota bacterium]